MYCLYLSHGRKITSTLFLWSIFDSATYYKEMDKQNLQKSQTTEFELNTNSCTKRNRRNSEVFSAPHLQTLIPAFIL